MKKNLKTTLITLTATASLFSGLTAGAVPFTSLQPLSASAATGTDYTYNSFKFTTNGNQATITGYTGAASTASITIPATLRANSKTYTVIAIGDSAFRNKTSLKTITFASNSSVNRIGYRSFAGCTALSSVTLPSALDVISTEAFNGCSSLKQITIPANVRTISHSAFQDCKALTAVTVKSGTRLESIGNNAFENCTSLVKFTCESFHSPESSNYVYFPQSMWGPGSNAFKNCPKIRNAYYHKNSISFGNNVFDYSRRVSLFYAEELEQGKFVDPQAVSTNDLTFTAADGNTYTYNFVDVNDAARGILLKAVTVRKGAVKVPATLPYQGVNYPVTQVGKNFLKECNTVTSLVFPDSITTFDMDVANTTANLKSVTLPKNLEKMGTGCFCGCPKLETVKYTGSSLSEVGDWSFFFCAWLDNYEANHPNADAIILGNYLIKFLGDKSTVNHSHELNIDCESGIITYNDAKAKYVRTPVHYISVRGFQSINTPNYRATDLKTISLKGVKKVYDEAFLTCSNLESVYAYDDMEWMGKNVFHKDTMTKLEVAKNSETYVMIGSYLYKYYNYPSPSKTLNLIGKGITGISDCALDECPEIETVYLPDSADFRLPEQCFMNSKVKRLFIGSNEFTYANVKNRVGNVAAFYENNYRGMEGSLVCMDQFLMPMCREILNGIGLTYYGAVNDSLTASEQVYIAGEVYRYCASHFHYVDTVSGSGEYTLYSNCGICGPQARAYSYLLYAAGVQAEITGSSNHAWDLVKIGDHWLNADVCWKNFGCFFLRSKAELETIEPVCHTGASVHRSTDKVSIALGMVDTPNGTIQQDTKMMGDVNNDGKLNAADVSQLQTMGQHATSYDASYADIDGDGRITTRDAEYLRMRLAFLDTAN